MQDNDLRNKRIFWIAVAILLFLVALTTVYFCVRLGVFSPAENKDYINLTPTTGTDATDGTGGNDGGSGNGGNGGDATTSTDPAATESTESTEPTFVADPELIIYDDKQVWTTKTQIDLFKISYENGGQEVTVLSEDGDKVIAPGTENTYTFRLKNTGNVAMNYSIHLEAYYSDNTEHIPVEFRMKGYYGRWIVGSADGYSPVMDMNGAKEHATLDPGNYAIYNLQWQWPFETGGDEYDTYLGNLAAESEEDVTLTVVIRTFASAVDGSDIPETGDETDLTGLVMLTLCAAVGIVIVVILFKRSRRNEEQPTEETTEETPNEGS